MKEFKQMSKLSALATSVPVTGRATLMFPAIARPADIFSFSVFHRFGRRRFSGLQSTIWISLSNTHWRFGSVVSLMLSSALYYSAAIGGETTLISVDSNGQQSTADSYLPSVSNFDTEQRCIAFESSGFDASFYPNVHVRDLDAQTTTRLSTAVAPGTSKGELADNCATVAQRVVSSGAIQAYWQDITGTPAGFASINTGTTELGNGDSGVGRLALSGDGRYLAFDSTASNLVDDDSNGVFDVFVHDTFTERTVRASVGPSGEEGSNHSQYPSLSQNGQYLTFRSAANNLLGMDESSGIPLPIDANNKQDIFRVDVHQLFAAVYDESSYPVPEIVSLTSSGDQTNGQSYSAAISANGNVVAFSSVASNLAIGDTNNRRDIFVRDMTSGATERVSIGDTGAQALFDSYFPAISADGQVIVFETNSALVSGVGDVEGGTGDIFARHRNLGTTSIVSVHTDGTLSNGGSYKADISADGSVVVFESDATNLVVGDLNDRRDIFLRSLVSANAAPDLNAPAAQTITENTLLVVDLDASDDSDTEANGGLFYSVTGGSDMDQFSIDSSQGVLSFDVAPDFEAPADVDESNDYEVEVTVTDSGGLTSSASIVVTITDDSDENLAPFISVVDSVTALENDVRTGTDNIGVGDPNPGDRESLTLAISGGPDKSLFTLLYTEFETYLLQFSSPPNYEDPLDEGGDNVYNVVLTVTDPGGLTDTVEILIQVNDVAEQPSITIADPPPSIPEGQLSVLTVTATDPDADDTLAYSITGGDDQALFNIDESSGVLTFQSLPDFESPIDADENNSYEIEVTVIDSGGLSDTASLTITVTNVSDNSPPSLILDQGVIDDNGNLSLMMIAGESLVLIATGSDPNDGDLLSYSALSSNPATVQIVQDNTNQSTFEIWALSEGSSSVTVTVDDGNGGSDSVVLVVNVGAGMQNDIDGDGILNSDDNCPTEANADQLDSYLTEAGDACEDTNKDGVFDVDEALICVSVNGELLINTFELDFVPCQSSLSETDDPNVAIAHAEGASATAESGSGNIAISFSEGAARARLGNNNRAYRGMNEEGQIFSALGYGSAFAGSGNDNEAYSYIGSYCFATAGLGNRNTAVIGDQCDSAFVRAGYGDDNYAKLLNPGAFDFLIEIPSVAAGGFRLHPFSHDELGNIENYSATSDSDGYRANNNTAISTAAGASAFAVAPNGCDAILSIAPGEPGYKSLLACPLGDVDFDGIDDVNDNCPNYVNPEQSDADADGVGDVCDTTIDDQDSDGVADAVDNCPTVANADQLDRYLTSAGDACEDTDQDGVFDVDEEYICVSVNGESLVANPADFVDRCASDPSATESSNVAIAHGKFAVRAEALRGGGNIAIVFTSAYRALATDGNNNMAYAGMDVEGVVYELSNGDSAYARFGDDNSVYVYDGGGCAGYAEHGNGNTTKLGHCNLTNAYSGYGNNNYTESISFNGPVVSGGYKLVPRYKFGSEDEIGSYDVFPGDAINSPAHNNRAVNIDDISASIYAVAPNGCHAEATIPNGEPGYQSIILCPSSDLDFDDVPNEDDNCPIHPNADQLDTDLDGAGDVCDTTIDDQDADGVADAVDNCPTVANADQLDRYLTTAGDACEDTDQDGVFDVDEEFICVSVNGETLLANPPSHAEKCVSDASLSDSPNVAVLSSPNGTIAEALRGSGNVAMVVGFVGEAHATDGDNNKAYFGFDEGGNAHTDAIGSAHAQYGNNNSAYAYGRSSCAAFAQYGNINTAAVGGECNSGNAYAGYGSNNYAKHLTAWTFSSVAGGYRLIPMYNRSQLGADQIISSYGIMPEDETSALADNNRAIAISRAGGSYAVAANGCDAINEVVRGEPDFKNFELCPSIDVDFDGILNEDDNCPIHPNADQLDTDSDGSGDVCDTTIDDQDGDGVADAVDNCPTAANADQLDSYLTEAGDACEDTNKDGVFDVNEEYICVSVNGALLVANPVGNEDSCTSDLSLTESPNVAVAHGIQAEAFALRGSGNIALGFGADGFRAYASATDGNNNSAYAGMSVDGTVHSNDGAGVATARFGDNNSAYIYNSDGGRCLANAEYGDGNTTILSACSQLTSQAYAGYGNNNYTNIDLTKGGIQNGPGWVEGDVGVSGGYELRPNYYRDPSLIGYYTAFPGDLNNPSDNNRAVNPGGIRATVYAVAPNGCDAIAEISLGEPGYQSIVLCPATDVDFDDVPNVEDNCLVNPNTDQADADSDGVGDVCDADFVDEDGDGVADDNDNCPSVANSDQSDLDDDGAGDACDLDIDGDGLSNQIEIDLLLNPESTDSDGDGTPDGDEDTDNDTVSNILEVQAQTDPGDNTQVPTVITLPEITAANTTVLENESYTITLARLGGQSDTASVSYDIGGTFTNGEDAVIEEGTQDSASLLNFFVPNAVAQGTSSFGTLYWAAGETDTKTLKITVLPDGEEEGPETIEITLVAATPGTAILNATASLTINDAIDENDDHCLSPTIFVENGFVVGGPDNAKRYRGKLRGTSGNDVMAGTDGRDRIFGYNGDDTICGYKGRDIIKGSKGNDLIFGGEGRDQLYGENNDDEIHGGAGNDKIVGGNGVDRLFGDAGKDNLQGQAGEDTLYGGADDDKLYGGRHGDFLYGEAGNDKLWGGQHDDALDGGDGVDRVAGQGGTDSCNGESRVSCENL